MITCHAVLVSAPASEQGKTLITAALARAWRHLMRHPLGEFLTAVSLLFTRRSLFLRASVVGFLG